MTEPLIEPALDLRRAVDNTVVDITPRPAGVPFVDLRAGYDVLRAEIDSALQRVIDRSDFILGEATTEFERDFADYCSAAYAIGVDSGFSAIELMLRSCDIGPGDEVITAANTFYSTVRAIEACGATPVLVDAEPRSRNIDPETIEPAITSRTRAIVPVHLYGHPADMSAIDHIARRHGLLVFEDACQAHGSRHRGSRVGSLSDAAAFSFYPAKNLGAFGDAGIVVTDRADIDERVRTLRNLGSSLTYQHESEGYNRRLDTIQAAVLQVKLRHLDRDNDARRTWAARYHQLLADLDVGLPVTADWAEPVYHLYVIEVPDRDRFRAHMHDRAIETRIHYPVPVHLQPAFRSLGHGPGDFEVSERLARHIVSLPMHPHMGDDDVVRVAEAVRSAGAVGCTKAG